MSYINLSIDGIEISAFKGMTILQAAQANGIEIPNLCNNDKLKMYGSCGLCVVEIENNPRLIRACATEIAEGMVIRTQTPRVLDSRKTSLELMFSNHTGDCKAPCSLKCPGNVDVQGYVGLIANGEYHEALKLIKENLPLPASIGRVCPHPCQTACRRGLIEDAINIAWLKRYVADLDLESGQPYLPPIAEETGKRIAIVGGGPSGLSAAYYLRQKGHEVVIYEAMPEFGGMLKYGIPLYRLPREIILGEVDVIRQMGVKLVANTKIGRDIDLKHLQKSFDAVYVAVGAWSSSRMKCPGEELEGVFGGIEFLNAFSVNQPIRTGKRIAVIGGGNTAMDAARTSMRLGAEKVYTIYRRTKEDMPAVDVEIEEAEEEGIEFRFLLNPVEFIDDGTGKVCGIKLQKMQVVEGGRGGKKNVQPVEGAYETLEVDSVIVSIGQSLNPEGLGDLELNKWGNVSVDLSTLQTNLAGVFAGGDCADDGATIAIDAINDGKNVAKIIHSYLNGNLQPIPVKHYSKRENMTAADFPDIAVTAASHMGHEAPEVRKRNFVEVVHGFTEEEAVSEGSRCLECGCMDYFECRLIDYGVQTGADPATFPSEKPKMPIVEETPFIVRDPNKCILCGMCIRTCEEVLDVGVLAFSSRGYTATAQPAFDKTLMDTDCIVCGQCVSVCPTGALAEKPFITKPVPMALTTTETTCAQCGVGCKTDFQTRGNRPVRVLPVKADPVTDAQTNSAVLCAKGRFGYGIDASKRITKPMIRKEGQLVEVTLQEAALHVAKKTQSLGLIHGPNSVAVSVSDRITNEEAWLLNRMGRELMATERIFSFNQSENGVADVFGVNASPNLLNELNHAECVLMVGTDIMEDHTVAGLNLRKAIEKHRNMAILNTHASKADKWAAVVHNDLKDLSILKEIALYVAQNHNVNRLHRSLLSEEEIAAFIAGLGTVTVSDAAKAIGDRYLKAHKALIIFDAARVNRDASRLLSYMAAVSGHIGSSREGIVMLRPNGNSQGLADMGVQACTAELMGALETGAVKGLFVVGEAPALEQVQKLREQCEYLVVMDSVRTHLTAVADVVLPLALPQESNGTITSTERKVQPLKAALKAPFGMENWEVLQTIMNVYAPNGVYSSAAEITEAITRTVEAYKPLRSVLTKGEAAYWSTGRNRILLDGQGGKPSVTTGLTCETPGFVDHYTTDVTKRLFALNFTQESHCSSKGCGGSCGCQGA